MNNSVRLMGILCVCLATYVSLGAQAATSSVAEPGTSDSAADATALAVDDVDSRNDALLQFINGNVEATKRWSIVAGASGRRGRSQDLEAVEKLSELARYAKRRGAFDASRGIAEMAVAECRNTSKAIRPEELVRTILIDAELNEEVLNRFDEAVIAYKRALRQDPENEQAQMGVARLALRERITAQKVQEQLEILQTGKGSL